MNKHINVTRRALIQRINRALRKEGRSLYFARGCLQEQVGPKEQFGRWVILGKSGYVRNRKSLEEIGRKLGVVRAFERVSA